MQEPLVNNGWTKEDLAEYDEYQTSYQQIQKLVESGILSRELCPEGPGGAYTDGYWHWQILKPEELPEEFKEFIALGEVRWLWSVLPRNDSSTSLG